jgi:hypothetical protein
MTDAFVRSACRAALVKAHDYSEAVIDDALAQVPHYWGDLDSFIQAVNAAARLAYAREKQYAMDNLVRQ